MKSKHMGILMVAAATSMVAPAEAADKKTLIEKIVPQDIQDAVKQGQSILGVYTGITGAISTVKAILTTFGILHPSSGPDFKQLFVQLEEHLDQIAGSLDWKVTAQQRDRRWGLMMSAVDDAMASMAKAGGPVAPELLALAYSNSSDALNEIMGPDGTSFLRASADAVTKGDWQLVIPDRPRVTNGQVYDWRLGVPELMQFIALRQLVIGAFDPDWKSDGFAVNTAGLPDTRNFLLQHFNKMNAGVKCTSSTNNATNPELFLFGITCADIYTGSTNSATLDAFTPEYFPVDRVARQVKQKMPIFAMRAMLDMLYAYINPLSESLTTPGSITIGGLCLEVKGGGTSAGTPVQLGVCNLGPAQTWMYDRASETIINPISERCLDVRDRDVKAGAAAQIWDCNGTTAQQWTWDPESKVLTNAVGTVLDVQWGVILPGTPVWNWGRNGTVAQQWGMPDVWDALARCVLSGKC